MDVYRYFARQYNGDLMATNNSCNYNPTNHAVQVGGANGSLTSLAVGTTGQFLAANTGADPSWGTPSSGITGPGSSTDNALVRWDGAGGTTVQNGVITEDDTGNLSISAAVSGASLSATVANTSNTASATAFYNAQVAGSTAADPYYKAEISGGQAWTMGLDNSDGDAWVLSGSATPGTTNFIRADVTTGALNYPQQPAFLAWLSTAVNNVTGDGTVYTCIYDNEVFDIGNNFNLGTSTFTAPITGKYQVNWELRMSGGTSITSTTTRCVTSNRVLRTTSPNIPTVNTSCGGTFTALVDMDAADVLNVTITTSDSGGKIDDFAQAVSGEAQNHLSVFLVC